MPRVRIHPSTPQSVEDGQASVEIVWTRGMVAQLSVDRRERPDDAASPMIGLLVDLDRHQLNALIRAARNARDQAYGADA